MSAAILVDVTRCTGCERCAVACVEAHQHDPLAAEADRATTRDGLSANRWCTVVEAAEGRFARKSCMHCLEPSCVSACLVGSLQKTVAGPVVYDPGRCIGCRYCMLACPFEVPRYEWSRKAPFMRKCDMCADRLGRGERPVCVEACPHEVLVFGPRAELLERAHSVIRDTPGRYLPRVWGETELGGTSVLYVSDVDLTALGWPGADTAAIPDLTEPVIEKTPLLGGTVLMGVWGLSAIIQRRQRLMSSDTSAGPPVGQEKEEKRGD
jgi:Fe-S-cluster-containing dehydrogenase component